MSGDEEAFPCRSHEVIVSSGFVELRVKLG
jgi:hypothetical protein